MIHPSVQIDSTAVIDAKEIFIEEGGVIGKNCRIQGSSIKIGKNFWMDEGALIGGGSSFDPEASLVAGDFLHMGKNSHINIARGVSLGDEVGIGINTQIFTHGAYLNELDGFPVQFASVSIGSNVWLPNAWINPGITIGSNVVVAAQSLINKDIPSGSLAGGIPVKILKENFFPRKLSKEERDLILNRISKESNLILDKDSVLVYEKGLKTTTTIFDCINKKIYGSANKDSEVVRNQLRRHGIRFRYSIQNNSYEEWLR